MKYGFVIDNRKCIGCHACTTACKSEHEVPVGVNRTWVKQVEKGEFPNTKRHFSVMRCNHCTDAPCVSICPTEALFTRADGIVDFDKDRCIGCKSCMQACPYDALYIDPEEHTAAKCNYCAHRIDRGLEPACVVVCPEQAIISGDMNNPESEISQLLSRQASKTRKPEKNTKPNVFYIAADDVSLVASATSTSDHSLWGSQSRGVGHFAKEAEKMAFSNPDVITEIMNANGGYTQKGKTIHAPKSVDVVMNKSKRVYDSPYKGILWGWEVSAYIWTKSISTGVFIVPFLAIFFFSFPADYSLLMIATIVGLVFLTLTGILLIIDLDKPGRFLYVLLRPHWSSWLVRGGYAITLYGGLLSFFLFILLLNWTGMQFFTMILITLVAVIVAIYTAFLFAQAKGRDFWQSPMLSIHMLVHAVMAGSAIYLIIDPIFLFSSDWLHFNNTLLLICIAINLTTTALELGIPHSTTDSALTVQSILQGRYKRRFWMGAILFGNLIPFTLLFFGGDINIISAVAGLFILGGIYFIESIWVDAPQQIPLS